MIAGVRNPLSDNFRVARRNQHITFARNHQGRRLDRWQSIVSLQPVGRVKMPLIGGWRRRMGPNACRKILLPVIEGLVILGEHSQAAQFYPLIGELMDTGAVVLWSSSHLTQTIAGIAAAAARQWGPAEEHFQIALQQAESFPHILEQAEIRRFHAMMLIDRSGVGDRDKAQTLLNEALQSYERIGMPRHVEMTQTLLARAAER